MSQTDYYSSTTFNSIETAICLEDTITGVGKFFIPAITPTLSKDLPYEQEDGLVSISNIISDTSTASDIKQCLMSNYIELPLPNGALRAFKGEKYSVQFIGGEVNKPVLMQKI